MTFQKGSYSLSISCHLFWSTRWTKHCLFSSSNDVAALYVSLTSLHLPILACERKLQREKYYIQPDEEDFTVHIYTDVIFHQLIGDSYASVLRCVHIDGKNNDSITKMYDKLHYVPIRKSYPDTIMKETKDRSRHKCSILFWRGRCKDAFFTFRSSNLAIETPVMRPHRDHFFHKPYYHASVGRRWTS